MVVARGSWLRALATAYCVRAAKMPLLWNLPFLALLPLLPLLHSAASSAAPRRIETPLTFGWRFQIGDLPFNGGPLLCSGQPEEVAFPISLKGKACALGPREKWSLITGAQSVSPTPYYACRPTLPPIAPSDRFSCGR